MDDKHLIELHGKLKKIALRESNNITVLFDDLSKGILKLTIPKSNMLYLTMQMHMYYNLFVELKGVSHVNNGRAYTNNILVVRRVVSKPK